LVIGVAFLAGVGFRTVVDEALSLIPAWVQRRRYRLALEDLERNEQGLTPLQLRIVDRALSPELNLPPIHEA
jgi:hypothetical protein